MKTGTKSMLIGFLLCAVGFLTIGATSGNNDNGKYQITMSPDGARKSDMYIMDTRTGEVYVRNYLKGRNRNRSAEYKWTKYMPPIIDGDK